MLLQCEVESVPHLRIDLVYSSVSGVIHRMSEVYSVLVCCGELCTVV